MSNHFKIDYNYSLEAKKVAQFYYRYSTMNAGKSIDVLKTYHNYKEQGKLALLFSSEKDDRYGVGFVASRIGMKEKAIMFDEKTNIYDIVQFFLQRGVQVDCVLLDECHFLKKEQVLQLSDIVDELNIPVIAYGLRTDFQGELFEGSSALFCEADKIEELKTICWFCNHKSTRNLRVQNDVPIFEGEQTVIGNNADKMESEIAYLPVCRKCMKKMKATGKLLPMQEKKKAEIEQLFWDTYDEFKNTSALK
jgi:thymidine kinase